MVVVNLKDLQVIFGEKTAVSAASFAVDAGETFSLIGASGCGKSTILRVLAGLQRDWRGRVELFDKAITPGARFQGELRRNVQMVFQDPYASLHPNHTLWRTLAEPLKIHAIGEIEQRVSTALQEVGLPADAARRYPHQLSGGAGGNTESAQSAKAGARNDLSAGQPRCRCDCPYVRPGGVYGGRRDSALL